MSKLAGLAQQQKDVTAKIAAMRTTRASTAALSTRAPQAGLFLANDAFDAWSSTQIERLNLELADLSTRFEEQLLRTKAAVGRGSAFEKLIKN